MAKQTNGSAMKSGEHAEESARLAEKATEHANKAKESAREAEKRLATNPEAHGEVLDAVK
jgi:hypothetical protein